MIHSIHHVGCLVPDIADAVADYRLLHPEGEASPVSEVPEQKVKVCFFAIGAMHVEFVQPVDETSSLYRQLNKHPGYYHIGIYVSDIDAEIERLVQNGYRKVGKFVSPAFNDRYCAFLYNLEMHLVELIEQA